MCSSITVMAVKWKDITAVYWASNFDSVSPTGTAKRWCTTAKKRTEVPRPKIIQGYNTNVGGVNLCDRFLSNYRPVFQ